MPRRIATNALSIRLQESELNPVNHPPMLGIEEGILLQLLQKTRVPFAKPLQWVENLEFVH